MTVLELDEDDVPVIGRLTSDLRAAARTMGVREARYLVDRYYQSQDDRKRSANQTRATTEAGEPCAAIEWLAKQNMTLESRIRSMLDVYSDAQPLGAWAKSIVGIGPVIAAGLLAHIDLAKCPTAGHIWSFAGLDPRVTWKGSEDAGKILAEALGDKPKVVDESTIAVACRVFRRNADTLRRYAADEDGKMTWNSLCKAVARKPWNAQLKVLCWKIGESFVKVQNRHGSYYGRLYAQYRSEEDARNASGDYAAQAAQKLERFNIGKTTDAYGHYSSGKLPPAHIYARSKRRVAKLFLSHYWQVGYEMLHKRPAPRPWAIEHGGHTHYIPPPNYTPL